MCLADTGLQVFTLLEALPPPPRRQSIARRSTRSSPDPSPSRACSFYMIQEFLAECGSHVSFPKAAFDRVMTRRCAAYDANFPFLDIGDIGLPRGASIAAYMASSAVGRWSFVKGQAFVTEAGRDHDRDNRQHRSNLRYARHVGDDHRVRIRRVPGSSSVGGGQPPVSSWPCCSDVIASSRCSKGCWTMRLRG
jgi:hypothetical protein